jgi:homogentisate 1,2-dioxygenase
MSGHGPDADTYATAVSAELSPHKIEDTMAFMFESRLILRPTGWAMETPLLQNDYDECWSGFRKAQLPSPSGASRS